MKSVLLPPERFQRPVHCGCPIGQDRVHCKVGLVDQNSGGGLGYDLSPCNSFIVHLEHTERIPVTGPTEQICMLSSLKSIHWHMLHNCTLFMAIYRHSVSWQA